MIKTICLCDRCGSEITGDTGYVNLNFHMGNWDGDLAGANPYEGNHYCTECMDLFKKVIESPKICNGMVKGSIASAREDELGYKMLENAIVRMANTGLDCNYEKPHPDIPYGIEEHPEVTTEQAAANDQADIDKKIREAGEDWQHDPAPEFTEALCDMANEANENCRCTIPEEPISAENQPFAGPWGGEALRNARHVIHDDMNPDQNEEESDDDQTGRTAAVKSGHPEVADDVERHYAEETAGNPAGNTATETETAETDNVKTIIEWPAAITPMKCANPNYKPLTKSDADEIAGRNAKPVHLTAVDHVSEKIIEDVLGTSVEVYTGPVEEKPKKKRGKVDKEKLEELYRKGWSYQAIAKELGCTDENVRQYVKRNNLTR